MEKYIKVKRNEYIINGDYYKKCEELKIPYAAIQDLTKWSYVRVDFYTLGQETYDKLNNYINENSIEVLDNIHHMIASYLNYNSEDEIDQLYCVSSFSWMKVRKEMAPVIVEAIFDTLMDIVKTKL